MRVIGLTGGIATGKSTVANLLAELGAVVIDADKVGHEVIKTKTPVWHRLVQEFGQGILKPDGEIDRQKLAGIAFSIPETRLHLNQITHPVIYAKVLEKLDECRRRNVPVVVLEAALLIEADWLPLVDEVWTTTAPRATVLKRLKMRSGMPEGESVARISSQLHQEERMNHADVEIDTDCSQDELRLRVKAAMDEFQIRHNQ